MQGIIRRRGGRALHRLTQSPRDLVRRDTPEIKALAAAEDRRRELLGLRRRQDKADMGRGLLQRLQQRVKGRGGQHVHLVDDINLEFPVLGRIFDRLPQVADFIHTVVGGRVDLHHIHGFLRQQTAAAFTLPAGIAVHRLLTVDGAGHDLRGGRFARAAAATEQVRMSDAPRGDLVAQRRHDGLLRNHGREIRGPPLAVKGLISHGKNLPC